MILQPWTYPGESYGYCAGGHAPGPTSNVIDKFFFPHLKLMRLMLAT